MQDDDVDDKVRNRFRGLWEQARNGTLDRWLDNEESALALVIVLDQFPRNMFRGDRRSFASDEKALTVTGEAIKRRFDRKVAVGRRMFFYLPYMHAEDLDLQDRCSHLIVSRLGDAGKENLIHAKAHRRIIEKFGRFPYRNDALGRQTSVAEQDWMNRRGYMGEVGAVREAESDQVT